MYITAVLTPEQTAQSTTPETTATASTEEGSQDFSSYLSNCQDSNSQSGSLTDIFKRASETYGVSMSLLTAMAKQESNFQSDATSKSGAMGIMQLMPSTAESLGVSNAYDPEQNIMGGAKYISSLLQKYNGDIPLALAAYNAGSNNVDKYGGIPPFEETQDYVAKITSYMQDGVTLPDGNSIAGSTDGLTASSVNALTSLLSKLFTYNDYQKFLTLFAKNMKSAISSTLSEKLNGSASDTSTVDTASADTDSTGETAQTSDIEQSPASLSVSFTTIGGTPVIPVADSTTGSQTPDVQIVVPDKQTENSNLQYAAQNIRYNNSVLNLMSQQES